MLKSEQREHGNAYCRYCNSRIIARLSYQWFIKVEHDARARLNLLLENGQFRIHPTKYEADYKKWARKFNRKRRTFPVMVGGALYGCPEKLGFSADWCISDKLNRGTPFLPICVKYVIRKRFPLHPPQHCQHCGNPGPVLETDVIDMWLSCALWCFCANRNVTDELQTLQRIAEKAICVTGSDLLYLWITIIAMLSTQLRDPLPFKDVIIHPVVAMSREEK